MFIQVCYFYLNPRDLGTGALLAASSAASWTCLAPQASAVQDTCPEARPPSCQLLDTLSGNMHLLPRRHDQKHGHLRVRGRTHYQCKEEEEEKRKDCLYNVCKSIHNRVLFSKCTCFISGPVRRAAQGQLE
jgi:hypothetical protein